MDERAQIKVKYVRANNIGENTKYVTAIYEKYGSFPSTKVSGSEKICDVLSKWENLGTGVSSNEELKLLFKKHLFFNPLIPSTSGPDEEFIQDFACENVEKQFYPVSLEEGILLAALKIQMNTNVGSSQNELRYESFLKFVPQQFAAKKLTESLQKAHEQVSDFSPIECQEMYLYTLRKWQYFGSTMFPVEQMTDNNMPRKLHLAVNYLGIHLFTPLAIEPTASFLYNSIYNFSPTDKFLLIIARDPFGEKKKMVFNTPSALNIANLMNDYTGDIFSCSPNQ